MNFILIDVMVDGIVSSISLSDRSFLVYRNAMNFCVLILYSVTFPNSSMNANSFQVASLGFSRYSIMPPQIELYLFLSNLDSFYFIFFSDYHAQDFQNYVEY